MLPNKVAATSIVALLLLQLAPGPATAQSADADLVISAIDVGTAVVGMPTTVRVTIQNVGDLPFQPDPPGWQIFLGWNAATDEATHCIDSAAIKTTSACYQRFDLNHDRAVIPGRTSEVHEFQWTPTRASDKDPLTQDRICVDVMSYGSRVGTAEREPDGSTYAANLFCHVVFVAKPQVKAVADRQRAPEPDDASNTTAWRWDLVTQPCSSDPDTINRIGCRAAPGREYAFRYRVMNDGNYPDTFAGTVYDTTTPSARNLQARGYKFVLDPDRFSLNPGGVQDVTLRIVVPINETAGNGINNNTAHAYVRWASKLNPSITTSCSQDNPPPCGDPTLPTVLASVRTEFWIGSNHTYAQVDPRGSWKFNLTLNNTGNAPDRYQIRWDRNASDVDEYWSPLVEGPVTLGPFAVANRSITVSPPPNATRGVYRVGVLAESLNDPDAPPRPFQFLVELRQEHALSGGALSSLARVVPDETATFQLFVKNDGNGPDNVTLTFETSGNAHGWARSVSTQAFTIPAFSSYPVTATLRAPPNTVNGTEAMVFLNVTSEGPLGKPAEERANVRLNATLQVLRGPNIRVDVPSDSAFIDPGQSKTFDLTVRNTGNRVDAFRVERQPGDPLWTVTIDPQEFTLEPLQERLVRVTLRAPNDGGVGDQTKVFVNVQAQGDALRFRTVNLTGRVSGPDLFVDSVAVDQPNLYSGDDAVISVVLGNRGNKAPDRNATLRVEYLKDGVPTLIGEERVFDRAELGGGLRLVERIGWNTTGIEGPLVLRARLDPDDVIREIEDSPASNEATRALTIRTLELRVTQAEPLSARPGERVSYSAEPHAFVIEYRGNQENEPVEIRIESEHGWGSASFDLGLRPFSPVALPVDVQIPAIPGAASDRLTLTVTPKLRPHGVVVSTVVTRVLDDNAPRILDAGATPESAQLGQPVTLSALVTDETGVREVAAILVPPSGDENVRLELAAQGEGRYSAAFTPDRAGTYRYYVIAVDNADAANANDTQDVLRTFRVTPSSVPTIKLAANQSGTIRTGTPIKLDVSDPLGLAKVNYTLKGITFDLERPFREIDTSSFAAGTVDIVVSAENVYGGMSSERFSFVVDNTPPTIRGVKMTPESPAVNEDVTITIETDGDATGVNVTVTRGGQLVGTHPAIRKGGGVWELVLTPGEGENVVDVVATDAAGNPKILQRALVFEAKPKGFLGVPGFEAVALLAALGVALVAWRRRLA